MGWLNKIRNSKRHTDSHAATSGSATDVIDVTDFSSYTIEVTLSIHELPSHQAMDDRFGAALCMITKHNPSETTGSVVPIGRRPHSITRDQFHGLIHDAGQKGHLSDGFLEIEAVVDLNNGTVLWIPEDGAGVTLPYLEEVVENTVASLVETNLFGEWFSPTAVSRYTTENQPITR